MTLNKLTPQVLQKWKLSIEKKKLGLKAKQDIYAKFRAFLNYEVKMGNLPSNPLTRIGNFKDPNVVKKKKINYYTADEFKQFIAQALKYTEESNTLMAWDFYVFFNIAFYTGMRKGEIYALKWNDIDENNILHVERSITQKLKGEDRETLPKNQASIRSLQLPIPLINILNQHKERYAKIDGFSENWRICGGIKPVRDSSIQNANSRFAKSAGIKTIRIHDFRHSHASLLANEGINIQEIARRLGHSQIEMTWNTYAPFTPERKKER